MGFHLYQNMEKEAAALKAGKKKTAGMLRILKGFVWAGIT